MLIRTALRLASPAGPQGRLSILVLHRVLPEPDALFPGEMHARRFDELCAWLRDWFTVLPLDRAVELLKAGTLPARALAITFDDGYADNHDVALPILRAHRLPATFFIATDFLDGGRMWNDTVIESVRRTPLPTLDFADWGPMPVASLAEKVAAIEAILGRIKYQPVAERLALTEALAQHAGVAPPTDLMMPSPQVRALHQAGMQIGAHTQSHPILSVMQKDAARRDIEGGRAILESLIGERVGLFAYPNGRRGEDYNADTKAVLAELGFDAAVTTNWGASRSGDDPFELLRFTPWDRSRMRFGLRMLQNLLKAPSGAGY